MTQYKTCSKCLQTKPLDEFGNHKNSLYGKYSSCLVCTRIMRKAYRERNKESIKAQMADNYQRNRETRLKYSQEHKKPYTEKQRINSKIWRANNKPLMAAYQRARTARKQNNDSRTISKKELEKLYKNACFYCGSKGPIELDHVIPIIRGGRHAIGNLVAACISCNRSKHKWFIMEWRLRK